MNTIGKYILTIWILLLYLPDRAHDYIITTPSENGAVFDNYVHCIYEDSDGFIWLGTGSTVERFDGIKSQVYKFEGNLPNYAPYLVNAIVERKHHEYLVGTIQGLWQLDHGSRTVERIFQEQINFPVHSLKKDKENRIFIGTANGLYIYQNGKLQYVMIDNKSVASENNNVLAIEVIDSENVWLLTSKGVAVYELKSGAVKFYPNTLNDCGAFRSFAKVGKLLYIGTEKRGIVTFDLSGYFFAAYWAEVKSPVTAISYEKGLLGIATLGSGIYLLRLSDKKLVYTATCSAKLGEGLLSDNISSILLSRGNIWCGTGYYLGINYLRNIEYPFRLYKWGDFTSKNLSVRSCYQIWDYTFIGTREGFYVISEKTGNIQHFSVGKTDNDGLRSNLIFSFYNYQGTILVGTCGGGVSEFNPNTNQFMESPLTKALTSNDIFMFLEDKKGNLWIAASDGLYSYDKMTHEIKEYNAVNSGMPGNIVYGIHIDSSERFWVGTDKGVTLFDCETGKCSQKELPADFMCNEITRYIFEGRDGTLLFSFLIDNRLFVVDNKLRNSRLLAELGCFNLVQDEWGNYWMGSADGIIKANEQLTRITLFPLDGLVDVMMGTSPGASIARGKQGQFLIPCMKGLVTMDPKSSFGIAPLQITDMLVNGELYADNYKMKQDTVFALRNDDNNLTFSFSSLEYEKPELLKCQYKLVGKDSTWHWLRGESKVSYYNLAPGDYVFMVRRALNESSVCTVTFTIAKSNTWLWTVGLAVTCVILTIFIILRRKKNSQASEDGTKEEENLVTNVASTDSYVKLSEEEVQKVIDALKEYMENNKPYLNGDLKQSEVATAIGCSAYILSAVFTRYLKVGYYDFINGYRVEEFKHTIKEGKHQKYTLFTLAEKCGFKSKTSFFRTFKKFTGLTPNEFIQNQEEN